MLWTALAGAAGTVSVVLLLLLRHRRRRLALGRIDTTLGNSADFGLYGLTPTDAARMQSAARADLRREQVNWGRDYVPDATDAVLPGRIGGIPRALRVRR